MKPGSIIAIKLDDEIPAAKIIRIDALELTAKLYGKNQLIVLRNWAQAAVQRRLICHRSTDIVAGSKTIVITQMLRRAPSRLTRFIGYLQGYQYKQHRRARRMQQDDKGDPRMVRRWCRRKKLTGTLYRDGFFITGSGFAVYLDYCNPLKDLIWNKK